MAGFSGAGYSSSPQAPSMSPYSSNIVRPRSLSSGYGINGLSAKRRKTSHGEDEMVPDLGLMGMESLGQETVAFENVPRPEVDLLRNLDEDVDELLRQEGGG